MLIAQISDCHVRADGGRFDELVDTSASLAAVVAELASLPCPPDVVLATGDLTESGTHEEYDRLAELLAPVADRLAPLPGNHDEPDAFRWAFANRLPVTVTPAADGHCSYVLDEHPVRLVALDTTLLGRHDGCFDDSRAAWLDRVLSEAPQQPTLVFTHFPPFATGLCFMDESGLHDGDRLCEVLAGHPQVRLLTCGHMHRPIMTTAGITAITVCPSTGHQLGLDLHPSAGSLVDEPPGYLLHRWDGERVVTHTATVWSGRSFDLGPFVSTIRARAAAGEPFWKV